MAFGGLYISVTGLQASQRSLDTVSHNISNADNPNYVRQSAIHANNPYKNIGNGMQRGTGVNVIEIRQIRDEFLDLQIRRELPGLGYFQAKSETLADIEGVFNEITNSGLQNIMKDFWNGWNELAKEPESLTNRALLHESAVAFTDTVNHISSQLDHIKRDLNKQVINKAEEANRLIDGIAKLNSKIKVVEGDENKMKANDYRDDRNAMIDRLSQIIPVQVYENSFGEAVVSLQGQDLVNGSHISKLEIRPDKDENTGLSYIFWENTNDKIILGEKGELAGVIDVRDESVVKYETMLDTLVGELANAINEVHIKGYGLGEDPDSDPEEVLFFIGSGDTITAANIKVNPDLSDFNKIAASKSGEVGDGEIAKEIYNIRDSFKIFKFTDDDKMLSIDDYYNDIVTSIALERDEARTNTNNQAFLVKSIDEKRIGLSSVSLDEEMADMIKFQHAYSANSRVINAFDEMLETIVNRLGIVGR